MAKVQILLTTMTVELKDLSIGNHPGLGRRFAVSTLFECPCPRVWSGNPLKVLFERSIIRLHLACGINSALIDPQRSVCSSECFLKTPATKARRCLCDLGFPPEPTSPNFLIIELYPALRGHRGVSNTAPANLKDGLNFKLLAALLVGALHQLEVVLPKSARMVVPALRHFNGASDVPGLLSSTAILMRPNSFSLLKLLYRMLRSRKNFTGGSNAALQAPRV